MSDLQCTYANAGPLVSVVIPNYNGLNLLDNCLGSLSSQSFRDFEVVLVDNGSSDGSVEHVRLHYPSVRLVLSRRNLGFGGGNNLGIRRARGRYVALLNNDAVASPGWLAALVRAAEESPYGYGMWACKVLRLDQKNVIDTAGQLLYADGLSVCRGRGEVDRGQYDAMEEALYPSGAAAMFLRRLFEDTGGFDEDFVAYCDDTELGLRARLGGWRCLYVPEAVVYHMVSATAGRYSAQKAYLVERNRVWVLAKCFPFRRAMLGIFYTFVRILHHLRLVLAGRGVAWRVKRELSWRKLILTHVKADLDALAGIPKMLRKRRKLWSKRRTGTEDFGEWLRRFGVRARDVAEQE